MLYVVPRLDVEEITSSASKLKIIIEDLFVVKQIYRLFLCGICMNICEFGHSVFKYALLELIVFEFSLDFVQF